MFYKYYLCKFYNVNVIIGKIEFKLFDIIKPVGATRPLFAQTYTILPDEAILHRKDNLNTQLRLQINDFIWQMIEEMMRQSPLGRTIKTAADLIKEYEIKHNGQIPEYQV